MLDRRHYPTVAVRTYGERATYLIDWDDHVETDHERELTDQTQEEIIADHAAMHKSWSGWGHLHPEGL